MTGRLAGKKTFITAAGQGIGRATAISFFREGAEVIATDINSETLNSLKNTFPKINTKILDVTNLEKINQVVEEPGSIDVLFNCVGFVHHGTILECDEEEWNGSFDKNVSSMYRIIRKFLPLMIKSGGGSIINMSSVVSSLKGLPNRFAYGASKAAVIGLTKSIAIDFIRKGIRCNAICPGTVESPSLQERIKNQGGNYDSILSEFVSRQPIGRIAAPEEISSLVVYLASDESAYTTGVAWNIDGGMI